MLMFGAVNVAHLGVAHIGRCAAAKILAANTMADFAPNVNRIMKLLDFPRHTCVPDYGAVGRCLYASCSVGFRERIGGSVSR